MFKSNKFKAALMVGLVASASSVFAQSTTNPAVETTASLQITNAFTFAEGDTLDFGIIRASQDLSASGSLVAGAGVRIRTDGSAPTELALDTSAGGATSEVTVITQGTPGTYNITGAIPNSTLQVLSEPTATLDDNGTPGDGSFALAIEYEDMRVTGGPNAGSAYTDAASNLVTDINGDAQLTVGGKLRITNTASAVPTGVYTGQYTITVSY